MAAQTCFHCGAPAGSGATTLEMDGATVTLCGGGCLEVARRIRDEGLTGFYRFRTRPAGERPAAQGSAGRWDSFDRPGVQAAFVTQGPDGTREAQLLVQGVRCAACSWLIERAMGPVPGVRSVSVDPLTTRMRLVWDPAETRLGSLLARIAALGYEPRPRADAAADDAARRERRRALRRLIVAGFGMSESMSYAKIGRAHV